HARQISMPMCNGRGMKRIGGAIANVFTSPKAEVASLWHVTTEPKLPHYSLPPSSLFFCVCAAVIQAPPPSSPAFAGGTLGECQDVALLCPSPPPPPNKPDLLCIAERKGADILASTRTEMV